MLEIVLSDVTFAREEFRGRGVWAGKCIHCNGTLLLAVDGAPISRATIEHIIPKNAGGTDTLENLALACARCNHQKGRRQDLVYPRDPRARELVERLLQKRQERWRGTDGE